MNGDLRLVGVGASPYTRKLRAALRFRRIPYRFVVVGSKEAAALPERPLPLLPYLVLTGSDGEPAEAMSDTTPILDRLEHLIPERPLRPADPALCLLDGLIDQGSGHPVPGHRRRLSGIPHSSRADSRLPAPVA